MRRVYTLDKQNPQLRNHRQTGLEITDKREGSDNGSIRKRPPLT